MRHPTTRRQFLRSAAAAGIAAGLPFTARSYERIVGANERLSLGIIGVAGRGGGNMNAVSGEAIVALCDVDKQRLGKAGERFKDAKRYLDWRELLAQDGLDGVVISTPDHQHAPAASRAMKRGLHVYCEKPLTHTVHEARVLGELAREKKVVTQMGTQLHQHKAYVRAVELVKSGTIGAVSEAHVITDRPGGWWKQGLSRPTKTPEVPDQLAWDLWLGPAPERPYHPAYVPFRWRGWWDFGCGAIGDMAIHLMDPVYWALDLKGPVKVSTNGPKPLVESGPTWMTATFEFPKRGELPACKVHWYEGTAKPPEDVAKDLPMNGCLFIGEKGRVSAQHGRIAKLLPEDRFKDFKDPEPFLPRSPGHHKQWIQCCKSGEVCGSNFPDYAGPFAELVLLGNVSYRTGKALDWDPQSMTAKDVPEAAALLTKSYRKGWGL